MVEKENCIKNSQIDIFLHIDNDLRLKWHWVKIMKNQFVQSPDVNNYMTFFLLIDVYLPDHKNKKIERGMAGSKLKLALAIYLVESFV